MSEVTDCIVSAGQIRISQLTLQADAFNSCTVENLSALVDRLLFLDGQPEVQAHIICSGREGFFCNGLSPLYMVDKDLEEKVEVFRQTYLLFKRILGARKQIVAEINGHANAAGAMLALAADYRIMARVGRFSFSEVKVGMFLPPALKQIVLKAINPAYLAEAIVRGNAYKADEARSAGLVDEVVDAPSGIRNRSLQWIKQMLRLPPTGLWRAKQVINDELINVIDARLEPDMEMFRQNMREGEFDRLMQSLAQRQR